MFERRRPPLARDIRTGHPFDLGDLRRDGARANNEARIRDLHAVVPLPDGSALARVLGRYKMLLDPADLSLGPHLMLDGYWEMWLTEALARAIRPGMVVADVGANVGYFTLLMADLVGEQGRVLAFEPNPAPADLLRRSLIVNGLSARVELHGDPLGRADGEAVTLYFDGEQTGGAFVAAVPRPEYSRALPLTGRRFDGLPGAHAVQLVKIDAEAAEADIWAGMAGMLAGDRLEWVFMEWSSGRYADPAAFLADMAAPGFALARLDLADGIVPTTAAELLALPPLAETMLVLRRGSALG